MNDVRNIIEPREAIDDYDGNEILDVADLGDAVRETKHYAWPQFIPDNVFVNGYNN